MATFVLFDKRNRNPGRVTSGEFNVPSQMQAFNGRVVMDAADLTDAALTITWLVQATFDGNTWVHFVGGTWQGGFDSEGSPQTAPNQTWQSTSPPPQRVRVEVTNNKRISYGVEVDI